VKKVVLALLIVVLSVTSIEAGWWDKIIKRMMREGVSRVDSSWDDAHAALMGIDAYYIYPKSFTAHYDFNMDGQKIHDLYYFDKEVDVSKDVAAGKYGPVDFSNDAAEIVSSVSRSERQWRVINTAEGYKIQAQTKIANYAERAKQIQKEVQKWTDISIEGFSGASWEQNAGVYSEKLSVMADNLALKTYMNELLALRTALTAELGLTEATGYSKEIMNSLDEHLKIYEMAR